MSDHEERPGAASPSLSAELLDVLVIGAGIAGLVAADAAAGQGLQVGIVDGHPAGGRARTTDRNGWWLNQGPHALYNGGPLARYLTASGLSLTGGDPADFASFGYRDGELHVLPFSPGGLVRTKLLGLRSKARFAKLFASLRAASPASLTGQTLLEFLSGEPDDVVAIVETLVRTTTFVNAPDRIDAGVVVAQLRLAQDGVRYLDRGWQSIIDAFVARQGARGIVMAVGEVLGVDHDGDEVVVTTASGAYRARAAIVATGGPEVEARLLGRRPVAIGEPVEATCLDLLLDRPAPRSGAFGVGTPLYLSPHSAVADLAPPGHGLLSGLHYLAPGSDPGHPEAEQTAIVRIASVLGVASASIVDRRHLHRITVAHSFPTAAGGGLAGRPPMATGVAGVFRAGDWVGPEGLIGDAAAASGLAAARAACERCARMMA